MAHENEKKDNLMKWWNDDLKFTIVFLVLGIIMGYVAFKVSVPLRAFLLSLVVFIGAVIAGHKVLNIKEGKGWWFSKFAVYIFIWFVVWTIFHTSCSIYNACF